MGKDEKVKQIINGNNNKQIAGNYIVNNHLQTAIQFYEVDIKLVIENFSEEIFEKNGLSDLDNEDFNFVEIEIKNEINNLSEEYFKLMKDKYLPYFYRIKKFINDPKNKKYSKLYNKTADELNTKIVIHRKKCEFFEEILEKIYNYIIESSRNSVLSEKRDVFWIFLNFMYWNCDVGDKYDKTT